MDTQDTLLHLAFPALLVLGWIVAAAWTQLRPVARLLAWLDDRRHALDLRQRWWDLGFAKRRQLDGIADARWARAQQRQPKRYAWNSPEVQEAVLGRRPKPYEPDLHP